jgi:hypothetical protein
MEGSAMSQLGRLVPPDREHIEKYPLTISTTPAKATPVVLGIDWYSGFDNPVKGSDGRYWIGRNGLGQIRGGHAICALPAHVSDIAAWWTFYNQGATGQCEGFSHARAMSLVNRARYDAPDLYFRAQDWAGQPRDPQTGTYNRAVLEVLRTQGAKTPKGKSPSLSNGIAAYRWATSSALVLDALQTAGADRPYTKVQGVPLINSWGRQGWPHVAWMPIDVLDRLLADGGEAGVIVDR